MEGATATLARRGAEAILSLPRRAGAGLLTASVLGVCVLVAGCGTQSSRQVRAATKGSRPSGAAAVAGGAPLKAGPGAVAGLASSPPPWPCTGWPLAATRAYTRASKAARAFGSVSPGDALAVVGRDADGWWAFAPGTAQAANVGPFRLRWLPPDAPLRLQGACRGLPLKVSPPPGVCFEMAMVATPIRARPRQDAPVTATLPADGYVRVTGGASGGWLRVDAGSGSKPGRGSGWIAPQAVNVNGPCDRYLHGGAGG